MTQFTNSFMVFYLALAILLLAIAIFVYVGTAYTRQGGQKARA